MRTLGAERLRVTGDPGNGAARHGHHVEDAARSAEEEDEVRHPQLSHRWTLGSASPLAIFGDVPDHPLHRPPPPPPPPPPPVPTQTTSNPSVAPTPSSSIPASRWSSPRPTHRGIPPLVSHPYADVDGRLRCSPFLLFLHRQPVLSIIASSQRLSAPSPALACS